MFTEAALVGRQTRAFSTIAYVLGAGRPQVPGLVEEAEPHARRAFVGHSHRHAPRPTGAGRSLGYATAARRRICTSTASSSVATPQPAATFTSTP